MKRTIFLISLVVLQLVALAGNPDDKDKFGRRYEDKITSGGLTLNAEADAFWIYSIPGFESSPGLGLSFGGFVDFKVTPRFVIQMSLLLNRCQSFIENASFVDGRNSFTSYGMEIPLVFMARFRFQRAGILYVGAGPYTEFVFRSQLVNGDEVVDPYHQVVGVDNSGMDVFALSNNNSGLKVKLCYELPCRLQFHATAGLSISDILGYAHSDAFVRPYKTAIGISYRIR